MRADRTRHGVWALALALVLGLVLALAGCGDDEATSTAGGGGGGGGGGEPLTVFAAASLTDVLPQIAPDAEYNFAGSNQLAIQIRQGAQADVYLAANDRFPQELHEEGLAEEPQPFATNRLVLIVPSGNPAGIESVADLAGGDVPFVLAAEDVPVGDYTREVLANLGQAGLVEQAASFEADVRDVLAKVALGEADAGFVYATDAAVAGDEVEVIEIPAEAQPPIVYAGNVIGDTDQPEAAQAFLDTVLGPEGQEAFRAAGFGLP